ncbi:MAG: histidine phosphatase family protein [Anaerolineales bacterium]|nr:histidine phosphatase family protein [Anaerolineales bacterium]
MTTFHFIRHGKRYRTMGDPGLMEDGRLQATQTAQTFASQPIDAIFTSPLRRTAETATILGTILNIPVHTDPRLRERMNWGDVPDQALETFIDLWNRCSQDRTYTPPGGDSSQTAGRRLESFIHTTAQTYPSGTIIAVSHGGVIADFLRNVFSASQLGAVRQTFLANPYSGGVIPECSITTVVLTEEGYRLEQIGRTV